MVVRNRAAIIRKAELTGDAGGLVSVSRRHRVSETERKRKREGRRNENEGEQYIRFKPVTIIAFICLLPQSIYRNAANFALDFNDRFSRIDFILIN